MIAELLVLSFTPPSLPSAVATIDSTSGVRSSIRRAGDVNGDGVPDLLLSNCSVESPEHVWVLSGKDGSAIMRVSGREAGDGFGHSMDSVGDVDGDGRADFVVGAQGGRTSQKPGTFEFSWDKKPYARVISGADGRMLHEFVPEEMNQRYAMCVAGAGDVDGDGRPDVIVGYELGRDHDGGEVVVYSGRDWKVLHRFGELMGYGISASGGGDLDGDGNDDVLVGDATAGNKRSGRLRAFSGKTGRVLLTIRPGERDEEAFPWSIASAGDVNGDRVPDILVSDESRFVRTLSGKDGSTLHEWSSHGRRSILDAFGSSLDSLGDIDGDQVPDVIVGANESMIEMFDEGYATIFSGKDGRALMDLSLPDAGIDVSGLGDVDGDHVPDFALCIPARHQVRFVSGKSFKDIREIDWTKLEAPKPASGK